MRTKKQNPSRSFEKWWEKMEARFLPGATLKMAAWHGWEAASQNAHRKAQVRIARKREEELENGARS